MVEPDLVRDPQYERAGHDLTAIYRRSREAYEQYLIEPHPFIFPGQLVVWTEADDDAAAAREEEHRLQHPRA